MNILMVTDSCLPDDTGGGERVINEVGKGLVKKGHNIYVLSPKINKNLPSRANVDGVRIYRYNVNSQNAVAFVVSSLMNSFQTFSQMLKKTSLDLINLHQPLSAIGVNLLRKAQKIPRVYTFTSPWSKEYEVRTGNTGIGSFIRKWVERKGMNNCKRIIVLSEYSREQILSIHKALSHKIEIIPGGVDTEVFRPSGEKETLKAELGISADKFLLFTVRRLVPRMGLENLVEAMAEIVKYNRDVILIIGGTGSLEEKLKKRVKDLGLEDYIRFTGFIEEHKLPLYYRAADLFILPTRYLEGFGLVTLEALSCGTPVLGTPVGGTKEILGKLNKDLLFEDTTTKSMAEKILHYSTSEDLLALSKKCRDFVVSNYSWDRIAAEHERIFLEVIS